MLAKLIICTACALLASTSVATRAAVDPVPPRSSLLDSKKAAAASDAEDPPPLLGTLFQIHTGERLVFDERTPSQARFDELLADRVTGAVHAIDPRLLDLLHRVALKHPNARVEIVSGYRSEKLNETLRKKGHHVASHSQHSLGHAVDFRIVEPGKEKAVDPRVMEQELRGMGWDGGVGVYTLESDWFVHADVGPNRRWNGY
ncbi:MAG TPA: DUF882 domain-containing protein [Polyangiaceae bacterium]|nr:DUF882 domain-containing protein [Polyangiaceae bacterium]